MKSNDSCPLTPQRADEAAHPLLDLRLVDHRVVELERRGLAARPDLHAAVPHGAVGAVLPPRGELLEDPGRVRGHRLRPGELLGLGRRGARQGREIEPRDRVVGDALEDPGPGLRLEVEVLDLLRRGDPVGLGDGQAERVGGLGEAVLVVEDAQHLGVGVQHLAELGEHRLRQRVVPARRRAADRHPDVDALGDHDVAQRLDVAGRAGLRHHVEGVDGPREAVPGEPVLRRLDQHHPVARGVERARQRQGLGHLAAADRARCAGRRPPCAAAGPGASAPAPPR